MSDRLLDQEDCLKVSGLPESLRPDKQKGGSGQIILQVLSFYPSRREQEAEQITGTSSNNR